MLRRLNSVFKEKKILKKAKKNFKVISAVSFLRLTDQIRFNRKINGGYFDGFIEKIRLEEHLDFYGKRRKTSKLGRSGTARILPMPAPMG